MVAIAFSQDARGKAVRGEEQPVGPRFFEPFCKQILDGLHEGRMVVEAAHEYKLARPRLFERT
jgi:hypothetical protein